MKIIDTINILLFFFLTMSRCWKKNVFRFAESEAIFVYRGLKLSSPHWSQYRSKAEAFLGVYWPFSRAAYCVPFMEPEGSVHGGQEPRTAFFPEPDWSTPQILSSAIHFFVLPSVQTGSFPLRCETTFFYSSLAETPKQTDRYHLHIIYSFMKFCSNKS
jgi:hypothetical protein